MLAIIKTLAFPGFQTFFSPVTSKSSPTGSPRGACGEQIEVREVSADTPLAPRHHHRRTFASGPRDAVPGDEAAREQPGDSPGN